MFFINISMVTNIYSGTASGQALFNDESCASQNHLDPVTATAHRSGGGSSVELPLGYAARKGFLKMLIHQWYRMLQTSAWLSWDTKLTQISQQGLVFLESISAWEEKFQSYEKHSSEMVANKTLDNLWLSECMVRHHSFFSLRQLTFCVLAWCPGFIFFVTSMLSFLNNIVLLLQWS